ncbi:MAG: IS630 family transposase [Gemmataceae bacterium]
MRTAGTPEELWRRRHLAAQRVGEGYSAGEVADFLGVNPGTVRRWVHPFAQSGDAGLAARPVSGRPSKLSRTQEKIISRWLSVSPTELGSLTDLWSAPRLARLIRQELGVSLNRRYLCEWLRQRDYTPQKPRRVPRERDDRPIARWLARDWPRIKQKARRRAACLMLLDESGLLMAPLLRRSWARRGHPAESRHKAGHREKVSVAGALWLSPSRGRLGLAYQTLIDGFFNDGEVAAFLQAVRGRSRQPLVVIWDRGPMHEGDAIEELLDRWQGRLGLEPLPPYSPQLMPVECLWRSLKYCRSCNFAPRDARHLNEVVARELNAISKDQILLRSFFHLSDLPLPRAFLS